MSSEMPGWMPGWMSGWPDLFPVRQSLPVRNSGELGESKGATQVFNFKKRGKKDNNNNYR